MKFASYLANHDALAGMHEKIGFATVWASLEYSVISVCCFIFSLRICNAKAFATLSVLLIFLFIRLDDDHSMNNKVLMAQQQIMGPSFPQNFTFSVLIWLQISQGRQLCDNGSANLEGPPAASAKLLLFCADLHRSQWCLCSVKWAQTGDALLLINSLLLHALSCSQVVPLQLCVNSCLSVNFWWMILAPVSVVVFELCTVEGSGFRGRSEL